MCIGLYSYHLLNLNNNQSFITLTYHHPKSKNQYYDNAKSTLKIKYNQCVQYTYQIINQFKVKIECSLFNPYKWAVQLQSYHAHKNKITSIGLRYITSKGYYWTFDFYFGHGIHFSVPILLPFINDTSTSLTFFITSILHVIINTKLPWLVSKIPYIIYKLSLHDYDFFGNNNVILNRGNQDEALQIQSNILKEKEKEIAYYQQSCMKRQADNIRKQQKNKNGFIIVQGLYGDLNDEDKCMDVTVPLQFYVNDDGDDTMLVLSRLPKKGMMGFYDVVGCSDANATSSNDDGHVTDHNSLAKWMLSFFVQRHEVNDHPDEKESKGAIAQLWIRYKLKDKMYEICYNDCDEVKLPSPKAKLVN